MAITLKTNVLLHYTYTPSFHSQNNPDVHKEDQLGYYGNIF